MRSPWSCCPSFNPDIRRCGRIKVIEAISLSYQSLARNELSASITSTIENYYNNLPDVNEFDPMNQSKWCFL